jgi:hypothetical protein
VFRLGFSSWLNPDHEVFGSLVTAGVVISVAGAGLVSIDTDVILGAVGAPELAARVLRWRV